MWQRIGQVIDDATSADLFLIWIYSLGVDNAALPSQLPKVLMVESRFDQKKPIAQKQEDWTQWTGNYDVESGVDGMMVDLGEHEAKVFVWQ